MALILTHVVKRIYLYRMFIKQKIKLLILLVVVLCSAGCQKEDNKTQTPVDNNPPVTQPTPPVATIIDIKLSATSIDFGNVIAASGSTPGGTGYKGFTITNPSTSNADLAGSVVITGNYFAIELAGPNYRLLPGTTITIRLTFKPLKGGPAVGSVSIEHNATTKSSPLVISLIGYGS